MEREWGIYFLSIVTSGLAYLAGVRSLTQLDEKQKKAHLNLVGGLCIGSAVIGAFLTQQGVYARKTAESVQKANEDRRILAEINNTALLQRLGADTNSIRQEMQKAPIRVAPSPTPEVRYRLGTPEYGGPVDREDVRGGGNRTVYFTRLKVFPPGPVEHPYFDIYTSQPPIEARAGFNGPDFIWSGSADSTGKLIRAYAQGFYSPEAPIELAFLGDSKIRVLKVLPVERR